MKNKGKQQQKEKQALESLRMLAEIILAQILREYKNGKTKHK